MNYESKHSLPNRRIRLFLYLPLVAAVVIGIVLLAGCTQTPKSTAQSQGQQQTEDAFQRQSKAVPYPRLDTSLERANLSRKLLAENKADQLAYVYLQSFGKVLGYYTIKGKVSSNQSQMTTDQLVVKTDYGEGWGSEVVNAPGDDGSYGPNEPGIFFFTTEGTLVKTNLDYVYSTQPLPFNVPQLNK